MPNLIHKINIDKRRSELFRVRIEETWKELGIKTGSPVCVLQKQKKGPLLIEKMKDAAFEIFNNNEIAKIKQFGKNEIGCLLINSLPYQSRKTPGYQQHMSHSRFPLKNLPPRIEDYLVEAILQTAGLNSFYSPNQILFTAWAYTAIKPKDMDMIDHGFHQDKVDYRNLEPKTPEKIVLFCHKGIEGVYTCVKTNKEEKLQEENMARLQSGDIIMIDNKNLLHGAVSDDRILSKLPEKQERWLSRYYAEKTPGNIKLVR